MYTFTEEEFIFQVEKSKSWGDATDGLLDMIEELIVIESYKVNNVDTPAAMVAASLNEFESGTLLEGLINSSPNTVGQTLIHFTSSIGCTFKHYMRKQ